MKRKHRSKPETETVGNVTVKIYERRRPTMNGKHRTVFEVSDYTTGRRRLRGFTDHEKARKEAKRIANQLATGETTAAKMLNSEAASYGRALELLRPTGVSLEMASATFAKCFEILEGDAMVDAARFYAQHRVDRLTRKPVAEVVVELIESKKARGKSIRYTDDLSSRLTRFAKDFAVDVGTVTGPDIQRWLDGLNCAPTTAKNFRRVLYTLFGFAESRGYVFKNGNPVKDTEQISASGGAIEIATWIWPAALFTSPATKPRPRSAALCLSCQTLANGSHPTPSNAAKCTKATATTWTATAPHWSKKLALLGRTTACGTALSPTGWPIFKTPRKWPWRPATARKWFSGTTGNW